MPICTSSARTWFKVNLKVWKTCSTDSPRTNAEILLTQKFRLQLWSKDFLCMAKKHWKLLQRLPCQSKAPINLMVLHRKAKRKIRYRLKMLRNLSNWLLSLPKGYYPPSWMRTLVVYSTRICSSRTLQRYLQVEVPVRTCSWTFSDSCILSSKLFTFTAGPSLKRQVRRKKTIELPT